MGQVNLEEVSTHYLSIYDKELSRLCPTGDASHDLECNAQKFAIKFTAIELFAKYPNEDKAIIWNLIYSAHVKRKSGVEITAETIKKVISADQSWKKSSGHAFEEMVEEITRPVLSADGINFMLQKETTKFIKDGKIKNDPQDVEWLKGQMGSDVFDLFAEKDGYVFGCIQAKTSIRDRVTRDREPSLQAMDHYFWSVVFTLNGDFLRLPKFKGMVNGGTENFTKNGWHGLYAFSLPSNVEGDRIYCISTTNIDVIKEHAVMAWEQWKSRRQWFNNSWLPNS